MFGRYELLERIGVGGMAEVWRARVAGVGGFEKILVVKKILPAFASNKTFIEMLLAEARLCGILQHTNIVQTFDNGEIDGQFYIAMELVQGYDLFKVLSRATQVGRRLPVEFCLFIAAEVAKGLAYAHNAKDNRGRPLNIIHRDVSPSNVLISEAGEVKVMDFGVARATMGGPDRDGQSRAGVLKGKLGYMSPEQVTGQPFDRRSDIFSLGIILYESITLKRLFLGRTDLETLVNIRDARIEHKFRKHNYIEESVRAILRMALARSADERYDSALDFHDDIVNLLFDWKIQVTNRSLAAFLAELFDDTGTVEASPRRRRKSALAPVDSGVGEADSVAFSPEEVKRQAALIKQRREAQRRASADVHPEPEPDDEPGADIRESGSVAEVIATAPQRPGSMTWAGLDDDDGDLGGGVQASTAAKRKGKTTPNERRPSAGSVFSDTDRSPVVRPDAPRMSEALTETYDDHAAREFTLDSSEFQRISSVRPTEAPPTLRESKLRPVPLSTEPRSVSGALEPIDAKPRGRRFHVRTGDGKVLGPVGRDRVEGMLRSRAVGPGAPVQVDEGSFRPIEEVSELREMMAEVIPDRPEAERSGELSRLNFPSLIFRLYTERTTGCLELRKLEAVKFICLRRGRPQHIASNQKSEMLGPFLVSQGFVRDADLATAKAHMDQQGGRLGDVLVGLNLMKPFQLYQVLEKQFRAKFIDAFGWDDATYNFFVGDQPPAETVPLDLDPISALAEGVRTKLPFAVLEPYFQPDLDRPYFRARNPKISALSLRLQARETKALGALMSCQSLRQALDERCRNRQQRLATLHIMFLMLQTGLLTFEAEA